MNKKCKHCDKNIEYWAYGNKDADGNEYCMNCVSKFECIAELEELEFEDD